MRTTVAERKLARKEGRLSLITHDGLSDPMNLVSLIF
jgi:hypothetical protein